MRQLEQKIAPTEAATAASVSAGNQLTIPRMLLDAPVHEGTTIRTLRQGLWLRPNGSTPDKGGNTVIVGHRFTYTQPKGTLYYLNKVRVGDKIGMMWHGIMHYYTVNEVKTVAATATEVEEATTDAQLTIYTCTPLWLPKDRLVVVAKETTE